MEAALGSLALTVAVVLYLAIAYWDTKVAPPLDLPDPHDADFKSAAARPR
jgi:hypothetical protein